MKDLLVHWQWGEKHFADKLIDFDLASNNGGWQWAASTGCDAQPYFRIFNPVTQSERFDPEGRFIRRYVPELSALEASEIHAPWLLPPSLQQSRGIVIGRDYPAPIVDHAAARQRALALFKVTGRARPNDLERLGSGPADLGSGRILADPDHPEWRSHVGFIPAVTQTLTIVIGSYDDRACRSSGRMIDTTTHQENDLR